MDFLVMLDINSKEVLTMYKDGGVEADESTALFFIDLEDIPDHQNAMDKKLRERFTPHSIGSIELLKMSRAGQQAEGQEASQLRQVRADSEGPAEEADQESQQKSGQTEESGN